MNARRLWFALFAIALFALVFAACGPAATVAPTAAPQPGTAVVRETQVVEATEAPLPTQAPQATLAPTQPPQVTSTLPPAASPTPATTAAAEERVVELEWPPQMRLGDSDLIRLSLIPFKDGYLVTTEFADHQTVTSTVPVARPGGYDLSAVARLDATGFEFSPPGEQILGLPPEGPATWRWTLTPRTAGQHRLSITLRLRWTPQPGNPNPMRETQIYSKGLEVRVTSFFGLTARQAAFTGLAGLAFGSTLSLPLAAYLLRPRRKLLQGVPANPALVIEPHPSLTLAPEDAALLRALFRRYARLVLEAEFRSGYSGARTFLALPIRADGRADAYTIAKLGERAVIQREFENYETFVKDSLPPITARIQEVPVTRHASLSPSRAALRYTFIGEPGRSPASLREALIADPDPSWLEKLFSTFGPNWWMQRHPYTFRLAAEYDRMLPAHYVLAPLGEKKKEVERKVLDGRDAPGKTRLEIGDCVSLRHFAPVERRADGKSLSLIGQARPGQPPLRVRWLSLDQPGGATARVVATRASLLCEFVTGFELCGLPDPFARLPELLNENVIGTQSTIHGDLNLENILVGPGGFVWLIDFAQTRDGHPLYDFAHLHAEIVAHVIAPQMSSAEEYLDLLQSNSNSAQASLLSTLRSIAARCLFNASQPREYDLAVYVACLGALKFGNLGPFQKHLLYLSAAHLAQTL